MASSFRSSGWAEPGMRTHCAMFAVDVVSFSRHRGLSDQRHIRASLYDIVESSCEAAGLSWADWYREDRGDALFAIAPPGTNIEVMIDKLVAQVRRELRVHNRMAAEDLRLRLRLAINDGYVQLDEHGVAGTALIHLFRLLDAPAFKAELARAAGDLALIVSDHLHTEVVEYEPGQIDASAFRPITVKVKETRCQAWIWLPPAGAGNPTLTTVGAGAQSLEELGEELLAELRGRSEDDGVREDLLALIERVRDLPGGGHH